MLRKLRADFNPEYLAAVFDLSGPTFRDEQAKSVTSVRRFDLKTQTFQETAYHGYKANRKEMPLDLVQQVPTYGARWRRTAFQFWSKKALRRMM